MIRPAYIWTWRGQWICGPRGTLQRCATKNMHVLEALLEGVFKKKSMPSKTLSFWERKMNHRSKGASIATKKTPHPSCLGCFLNSSSHR